MAIEAGQHLSHYRLIEKIGEGGMGVVWKALDTALDREVAIKILPEAMAGGAQRRARFQREAKLLASLNHPGIATVFGVHDADGVHFLAMELVPGEDLALRLERGRMEVEEAIAVARRIAEALEAAHGQGVIHRDLKPGNVLVMKDGAVKILDFGLAKALAPDPAEHDPAHSATITSAGSGVGVLLGTAAYMSPEQARGHDADARGDVWAFGCCAQPTLGSQVQDAASVSQRDLLIGLEGQLDTDFGQGDARRLEVEPLRVNQNTVVVEQHRFDHHQRISSVLLPLLSIIENPRER
jgi:serine/threonine protein kinase